MEAAQRIRDELQRNAEQAEILQDRLRAAQKEVELDLLLADLASLLNDANTRNWSEGQRIRLKGLRQRLSDMRAA
jgi:hypothetical protein